MTTPVDEAPIGVWLWLVLIVGVNAGWIAMDVWLSRSGHEMLTTEFREGLQHPLWGPVLYFVTFGTVAAFVAHMMLEK